MGPDRARLWDCFLTMREPAARSVLIEAYLPLVRWVASRLTPLGRDTFEREGFVSSGVFGLADAIDRFVPCTGTRFETFAVPRIRGAILDALRALEWAPRSVRQRDDELFCVAADLATRLKRSPTTGELLAEIGISREALASLRAAIARSRLSSFDHRSGGAEIAAAVGRGHQGAGNAGDPAHAYELAEEREVLLSSIAALGERQRVVTRHYYFDDLTMKEIGRLLGVSEGWVSKVHAAALRSLAAMMGAMGSGDRAALRPVRTGCPIVGAASSDEAGDPVPRRPSA
jgi:RNA polymerase sigma factor for flagellar operon FliA